MRISIYFPGGQVVYLFFIPLLTFLKMTSLKTNISPEDWWLRKIIYIYFFSLSACRKRKLAFTVHLIKGPKKVSKIRCSYRAPSGSQPILLHGCRENCDKTQKCLEKARASLAQTWKGTRKSITVRLCIHAVVFLRERAGDPASIYFSAPCAKAQLSVKNFRHLRKFSLKSHLPWCCLCAFVSVLHVLLVVAEVLLGPWRATFHGAVFAHLLLSCMYFW